MANVSRCYSSAFARLLAVLLLLVSFTGCDRELQHRPAAQRPVPAELAPEQRPAWRRLPIEGTNNFRDLGGYATHDGRVTRWGILYRSDKLSDLSNADQQYLHRLNIQRIVDFRSQAEVDDEPDNLDDDLRSRLRAMPIALEEANVEALAGKLSDGTLTPDDSRQFLKTANREFVDQYTPLYGDWLRSLAADNATPMVFHCSEGKDRTGFAAAVLLLTLGVDRDTVMRDYLASNQYIGDALDSKLFMIRLASLFRADTESLRPIFTVERQYLQSALDRIDTRYGSFENYLREGLQVDAPTQQVLINRFTRPVTDE